MLSSLDSMKLEDAVLTIKNIYQSFSIKTIIYNNGEEWKNIFTLIYMSNKNKDELITEFKKIEDIIGSIDLPYLKLLHQSRDIIDLDIVLDEIDSGILNINSFNISFYDKPKDIKKITFRKSYNFLYVGEHSEYNSYMIAVDGQESPNDRLRKEGVSPTVIGLEDFNDIARSWLNIESFSYTHQIIILVPCYAKIISTIYEAPKSIRIDFKLDKKLYEDSTILIIRKTDTDKPRIINRAKYDAKSCESNFINNNYYYLTLIYLSEILNPDDLIEIILYHKNLGILHRINKRMSWIYKENEDVLIRSFELFEAKTYLKDYLFNPKNDKCFEIVIGWLFQLFGFKTICFNKLGERIKENDVIKISADILAYYSKNNQLFCIDCTITSPPPDKIDKIKHTAEYISSKINYPVIPLIISAIHCPSVKSHIKDSNVRLLDREDINNLFEIYQNGPLHFPKIHQIIK